MVSLYYLMKIRKPRQGVFKYCCKNGDTEVFKNYQVTRNVTFVGEPTTFCPTSLEGKVFNETDLDT